MRRIILLLVIFYSGLSARDPRWGWETHRYINNHAVDYLPVGMSFFQNYRDFLETHAADPDLDEQPGYYHYIDIDYYPEFFTGTLPHDWDAMLDLYGLATVTANGIIPWVIQWWTDSLSVLMSGGQWPEAQQIAAELGHYVADSHQPLHLTLNYNGQNTGNYGIHARYEIHMINAHLSELTLPQGSSLYWDNTSDSIFQYIDILYPGVALIMAADDLASGQDPEYGTTYYDLLWSELDSLTTAALHMAILDLASLWHTAWVNAGSPVPQTDSLTIIHVPGDQPGIQAAIHIADAGDTVLVHPGWYQETIDFLGKNITVGSLLLTTGDSGYINQTVIDGNHNGSVVTFANGEDSTAVLTGFTITGGNGNLADPDGDGNSYQYGGGIYCANSSPVLKNLRLTGNTSADGGGGGLFCYAAAPILEAVEFDSNTTGDVGGAVYGKLNSHIVIRNSTLRHNSAAVVGGGLYARDGSDVLLEHVLIVNNHSDHAGGGLGFKQNCAPVLTAVTITGNYAAHFGGGIYSNHSFTSLMNTILWDNGGSGIYFADFDEPSTITIAWSDIQGGRDSIVTNNNGSVEWLDGNIDLDPRFCAPDSGDFRLRETSPCAGTGYDGSDMGALPVGCPVAWAGFDGTVPPRFILYPNYPNPFNSETVISFDLHEPAPVKVTVYDIQGRMIAILLDEVRESGRWLLPWTAADRSGRFFGSGLYVVRVQAGQHRQSLKMLLIR